MPAIDRRFLRFFDWYAFLLTLALSAIGILFVFSATYTPEDPYSIFFKKQVFGVISGFGFYALFCIIDYRVLQRWGYFIYFTVMSLLVFTILKGSIGMGAQRWIDIGFIKFQPSELTKLFFPAYASYYFLTQKHHTHKLIDFMPVIVTLLVSALLILKQPDLGTALIILFSGTIMLIMAHIPRSFIITVIIASTLAGPFLWKTLKPYQQQRIITFLGGGDARKERYQIDQSCIAVGSGGMWGKGYCKGTQNTLRFLPEGRTDFIFSVLSEETGFVGSLTVILLYFLLIIRFAVLLFSIRNFYVQLLAIGLMSHIIFSIVVNIGMVMGLMPIVGIPLPLLSYGITHCWITLASLGWLNGIAARRFYS